MIHPVATAIMIGIGFPAFLTGAVFFTVICLDQSDNYNNPATARAIVKSLREDDIDLVLRRAYMINEYADNGIIPKEHAAPIIGFLDNYIAVLREEGLFSHRRYISLDRQAELMQQKVNINNQWKAYRDQVNLSAQLPSP